MIDYNNGKPNARYWVLKLILDNFHAGDRLVTSSAPTPGGEGAPLVQGFVTAEGRKILLVNKSNAEERVTAPADFANANFATVDEATGDDAPRTGKLSGTELTLAPFAVTVLTAE
jgi:hypothetical protein